MPAPKSSRRPSGSGSTPKAASSATSRGSSKPAPAKRKQAPKGQGKRTPAKRKQAPKSQADRPATKAASSPAASPASNANVADQVLNRVAKQLDVVLLTRDRIQETLDDAAERGRVTRSDANMLVSELVQRGRQQRADLLQEIEQLLGRGVDQIESATRRARRTDSVDRLVRSADRARRTVGVGPAFPILGYDELSARQVEERLAALQPAEMRKIRDYERRHANRKTVLAAIERALD